MPLISEISNNEAGSLVRFKLNQIISAINTGGLTNTILSGNGVPNNALGKNGDFYINLLSLEFYGPKVGNAWSLPGISLIGPAGDPGLDGLDGTDGSTILSGSGVPGVELGLEGDYYFDSLNSDFYGPKTAGIWGTGISLVGPPGSPGTGLVPSGEYDPLQTYEVNDMISYEGGSYVAIQSTTGNLPTNATYWLVVANKGIDGIDGTNGIDGVDGRTILSTTGAPGAELGEDGDFALDPAASLLYGPKMAGAWGSPVSIKGDPGPAGSVTAASTLNLTEQGNTPTTPSAGTWELYAKAAGIYALDDAGVETQLGVTSVAFDDLTSTPTTLAGYGITDAAPLTPDINAQIGTTYTLALGDAHGLVTMDNADANTLTIPTNTSVAFPTGTVIEVWQIGAGATTIEADVGVTLNGVSAGSVALGATYAPATLRKIGADAWLVAVGGAANVA